MHTQPIAARDNALVQVISATLLARAHGLPDGKSACLIAGERYGFEGPSVRALIATQGGMGGYLIPSVLDQAAVISALNPLTVVRRATPTQNVIPMIRGNITIPRVDAQPSVGFIGEDAATPEATGTKFGAITLLSHKLMVLQPIGNDLIRYGSDEVENVVRDLLLREFANVEDKALLQGTGANFAPKGLRFLAKRVNTATSTPTNAQIAADLLGLVSALTAANVPMLAPTWFMTNTAREFLLTLPSSSGVFQFPDVSAGTLMGYPVASSTSVPSGVVILADMSQFLLGQSELTVTLMPGATYTNSAGTRVSAFDTDTSVIKLVMGIDCALKHDEAAACLVSASWG